MAVFDGTTAPAAGTGTVRLNSGVANDYLVWNAARPQDGVRNWAGFYTTSGSNLNILPDGRPGLAFANGTPVANFPAIPSREFSLQSTDSLIETDYVAAEVFLNRRLFGKLDVELAANRQQVKRDAAEGVWRDHGIDINTVLPGGGINPNFGKAYADVIPSRQTQENNIKDYRLAASYPFETSWMRQRVSIFLGRKLEQFRQDNYSEARLNGPNPDATHATNQIAHRVYWDEINRSSRAIPSAPGTLAIGYRRNNLFIEEQDLRYSQVAAAGRYFDGRVSTILGYRGDRFKRDGKSRAARDATGYPILGPSVLTDVTVNTGSAGTVVFPFKSRTLGLYVNGSETFNAPGAGAALINGASPEPSMGKGLDVGLKLDLFQGRLAGSIGYYKTREVGRLVGGPSLGDINEIWLDLGKVENQLAGYRDTQTFQSKGWELDLTASLARGWKLLVNYGRPETSQIDTLPGLKSYYAAQIAEWRAGSTNPTLPNAARIATNIGDINRALEAANEGRRLNNTVDYTFNIFTDYTLQTGALKGLSFGGGANVRGKNLVGNVAGQPFNYLYSDNYYLVSGKLGYRFKLRDRTVRVQLNASNLLDHDDIVVNGYSTFQGRDVANGYYYLEPRKFVLTATFDF
jgi:hypothetical protein